MAKKNIETVISPAEAHWVGDGFRVHNFIPYALDAGMRRMNPFIMLDYNAKYNFPPSPIPKGVGVHPHRGFETVTIAYKGRVEHHDSAGNGGIIGEGDVQWMTAARGILHKEYHEKEWSKNGGIFQMVQLWVNLPAKDKMSDPRYQAILNSEMGKYEIDSMGSFVEVIAGDYKNVKGPAKTFSPIQLMNFKLKNGAIADVETPANYNTALIMIQGIAEINSTVEVKENDFILMANDGEEFSIRAKTDDTIVLMMSGEPIDEAIFHYGPFVMNTKEEIYQAFEDYNSGKFGHLQD